MPLLGSAAMLLSFDIAAEAIAEHDRWHTHEHLPERLSIPGFLRGTRWVALEGEPRYMVLYEVADLATLSSQPYLDRLNHPTPWTRQMMAHYRGMRRGLCAVRGSFGLGAGHVGALIRFAPQPGAGPGLHEWLLNQVLPGLPARPGLGSAHLLEGAATPSMTSEQSIRGADAGVDSALVLTGYDRQAVTETALGELAASSLIGRGAASVTHAVYRIDYALARAELLA